ncbi:uncharacterized protein N7459_007835 [Penicillium hispanicum]|uniref:uncharacterized protein n=1 Tax=Penicillium hispanicum TaxID=1080232 RepID=UPI00254165F0|nr:uncharacterized protein N7459_007835 [Penicillium hispanicum]KAJ5573408.1 hypothetical protein N7459_007835 [Penicillium hispanicum]
MAVANGPSHGADATMDIDMDLDLGLEHEHEPEPEAMAVQTEATMQEDTVDPLSEEALYEKVHVRGVDEMTTDNIKQFATSHFDQEVPSRVEWIDDTSANIVYSSADVGLQALAALTQVSEEEGASALPYLRLRSAKLLSTHPDSVLQVRSAVKTDRKQPRAYEKSRFYLMHPEHDPRERLRQELADRRRHGGDSSDGDYRRRRFDDRELRRRRDRDYDDHFDANMYDDQPESFSDSERGRGGRRRRGARDLFPDEENTVGRLRNRSASPGRDTLDDADRIDRGHDSRRRFRERSPRLSRRNEGLELFPSKSGGNDSNTRELFPNKPTSSYLKKELFPSKTSNHRRSDAFDAADETADLLGRRISVPLGEGGSDQRNRHVELFPDSAGGDGNRIQGSAKGDQGFAIRGASTGMSIKGRGASVRELFPSKYNNNNAGKELFSDTLEGRGGRRRRAEDMFG